MWHVVVPAAAMGVAGVWNITRPGLWRDEIITWSASDRSWYQIARVVEDVDAVLAPYYLLMSAWTWLFGDSHLSLRLPSLLAMIGAAGLVGAIGARLHSPLAGAAGGLVFAALPITSRFAQEARPIALACFASALATLLLLRAWAQPSRRRWIAYAIACAATGWLQLLAFTIVLAHAAGVVLALVKHRREVRGRAIAWLIAVGAAAVAVAPLLYLGMKQQAQVSWLPLTSLTMLPDIMSRLAGSLWLAGLLLALAVAGLVLAGWRRAAAPATRGPAGALPEAADVAGVDPAGRRFAVHTVTAVAVLPFLLIFVAGMFRPLFHDRYVVLMFVAWAAAAGVALARMPRVVAVLALLGVLVLGYGEHVTIREPGGHTDAGVEQAAALINERYQNGDAIVIDGRNAWLRLGADHYLDPGARPKDVMVAKTPEQMGGYLASECEDAAACIGEPPRIWAVCYDGAGDPLDCLAPSTAAVLREGYELTYVEQRGVIRVGLYAKT